MNCAWIQRLIGVHGELDRPERRAVAAHLRACDDCQIAWRDETRVKAVIAAIPDLEPPPGLEARLLRIPSPPPSAPPPSGPGIGPTLLGPTGGSALVAAVVIGASLLVAPRFVRPHAQAAAPVAGEALAGAAVAGAPPPSVATIVTRNEVPPLEFAQAEVSGELGNAAPSASGGDSEQSQTGTAFGESASGGWAVPDRLEVRQPAAVGGQGRRSEPEEQAALPPTPDIAEGAKSERPPAVHEPPEGEAMVSPVPATSSPTPATCASLSLHVFADVAGAGPFACAGCDGLFDETDATLAEENGLALPVFEIRVVDSKHAAIYEGLVAADGASVWVALPELCGSWPMTAHLVNLPSMWAACPASGSLSRSLASDDAPAVFPLTSGCVESTATVVVLTPMPTRTPLPTETPDPVVTPSAQPGPGGQATAHCEPTATQNPQSDPTSLPTTRPEPSPTAAPTDEIGVAATPAARLRLTPTATPILRTEQTPASWVYPSPTPTPKLGRPGDPRGNGR